MAEISGDEKLRRRESNDDVLGTHAMEGLAPDAETLALMNRFAVGEISREELSTAIDLHVQGLLAKRSTMAGVA